MRWWATWYLTANYHVTGNWVRAHLNGAGSSNIFQVRFQVSY